MNNENTLLEGYFRQEDITGMTQAEFQIAMTGLIQKGLMEVIEVNGQKLYRPTLLLQKIQPHIDSDPKGRN